VARGGARQPWPLRGRARQHSAAPKSTILPLVGPLALLTVNDWLPSVVSATGAWNFTKRQWSENVKITGHRSRRNQHVISLFGLGDISPVSAAARYIGHRDPEVSTVDRDWISCDVVRLREISRLRHHMDIMVGFLFTIT